MFVPTRATLKAALMRIFQYISARQERILAALMILTSGFVSINQYRAHGLDLARWDMLLVTGLVACVLGLLMIERIPHRFRLAFDRSVEHGVLDLTNAEAESLYASLRNTMARWSGVLASLSAVAMLIAFIVAFFRGYAASPGHLMLTVLEVAGASIGGFYLGRLAAYGQFGSVLRRRRVALKLVPDHADGAGGLKPIGDFYLFQALVAAIPSLFVGLWALLISVSPLYSDRYGPWQAPYLGLLVVTLIFVFLALIVPMWSLHKLMEKEKEKLEDQALKEGLQKRYRAIERIPTWPLDLKLFGTVALNLIPLVAGLVTIGSVLSSAESPGPDTGHGPEMIVIEARRFSMGSNAEDPEAVSDERPQHEVTMVHPFAIARYETSVGAFRAFVEATGYETDAERGDGCYALNQAGDGFEQSKDRDWRNPGFRQTNDHPVVCVSWNDARAYADWLSKQTGARYRLPTEAEWELAARAGTDASRYWENQSSDQCLYANGADQSLRRRFPERPWSFADCDDGQVFTAPTGSFSPNAYGLHDVLGNVWEWAQDCWNDSNRCAFTFR